MMWMNRNKWMKRKNYVDERKAKIMEKYRWMNRKTVVNKGKVMEKHQWINGKNVVLERKGKVIEKK